MVSLDVTLTLPDELAQQAQQRGLLAPEALQRLISAELERQQRVDRLFTTMDRLAATDKGDLTEADIQAEIDAYRGEKRTTHADRG